MNYTMAEIDEVRKRAKVNYEKAKEALDMNGGDVLNAVIYLERQNQQNECAVKTSISKLKEVINSGFISQIQVIKGGQVVFDIPVVAGLALLMLWTGPFAAALLFAVAAKCDLRIVKRDGAEFNVTEVTAEKLSELISKIKDEYSKFRNKSRGESYDCCENDEDCDCDSEGGCGCGFDFEDEEEK